MSNLIQHCNSCGKDLPAKGNGYAKCPACGGASLIWRPSRNRSDDTPTDGRYSESIDGLTWNYEIEAGRAIIGSRENARLLGNGMPALASHAEGAIAIPSKLGRCPVTDIGNGAFAGQSGITSLTIPDSVSEIWDVAFFGCSSLTSFSVTKGNMTYSTLDGVLYFQGLRTIVAYPCGREGTFAIPDRVTSIGEGAFCGCTGLTSVTIPESVTEIGGGAFCNCVGLTSVVIPKGVTRIESGAFCGCISLTSVMMPSGVTSIEDGAFSMCIRLKEVPLPNGLAFVGEKAFGDCLSLSNTTKSRLGNCWPGSI